MKLILNTLLFISISLNIVFPNAFQLVSLGSLILCNFFIIVSPSKFISKKAILSWMLLSFFFLLFIFISSISINDKLELTVKYIFAPILWINIFDYLLKKYSSDQLINYLFNLFLVCCCSVIILYIMTSLGLQSITSLFISSVNINQYSGLGFTLHVYGSMLFLTVALFPLFIASKKSKGTKLILFFLLIIAIILSGRTALYLSLFLAFITFMVKYRKEYAISVNNMILSFFGVILFYVLFSFVYQHFFDVDLFENFVDIHLSKVESGGGSERSEQFTQILNAIYQYPFGNGFITLDIIRDFEKPYNYEMLIVTTVMRFGIIIGLLIVYSLRNVIGYAVKFFNSKNYFADVMFLGFIGIVISSVTNPYLESFSFQWMFFGPVVYFSNYKYYEGNISK